MLGRWLPRILLGVFYAYMVAIAATYNGILDVGQRLNGICFLGIFAVFWLLARWRRGWKWHADPLDVAMVAWIGAFGLSFLTNIEDWRRIAIGLWFMAAYIAGYYALSDTLANKGMSRWALLDALLIGGLVVVFTGWLQIFNSLQAGGGVPRPVGTLGNPNTLAAALVAFLPIALVRAAQSKAKVPKIVLMAYCLLMLALLVTTFSRGGWIGAAAGLIFCGLWLLYSRGWTVHRARVTYQHLSSGRKALVVMAGLAALAALVGGAVFIVYSLGFSGRTADLRTFIYETAIQMFIEKPIVGYGVFTFGAGLARLNPTPPTAPHSHAHNLPLHIGAELGLVGLAALALMVFLVYRAGRRNLRLSQTFEPDAAAAAGGAVIAMSVHHLFDLPAMNPAVMITGLMVLAALVVPAPASAALSRRGWARGALLIVTGGALFGLALTAAIRYRDYWWALSDNVNAGNWVGVADALDRVAEGDPDFAPYYQQQGLALSIAAMQGDATAVPRAISAFERFVQLSPQYASGWASLAALYAQAGQIDEAATALQHLAALSLPALESWRETGAAYGEYDPDEPIAADDPDYPVQQNINYIQWLHLAFPRTFAPQTTLPLPDEVWAQFDNNS